MAPASLNDEETYRLIELFRQQENLYNPNSIDYFNRVRQLDSLRYICIAMGRDHDWTIGVVKNKLKNLRTQYTANLAKIRSAEATNNVFRPSWRYFHMLDSFLRPFCSTRKSTTNASDQVFEGGEDTSMMSQSHSQESEDPSFYAASEGHPQAAHASSPSCSGSWTPAPLPWAEEQQACAAGNVPLTASSRKRKKDGIDEAVDILRDMAESRKTKTPKRAHPKSVNAHFCDYVSAELDRLAPEKQSQVRKQIFDLVFSSLQES